MCPSRAVPSQDDLLERAFSCIGGGGGEESEKALSLPFVATQLWNSLPKEALLAASRLTVCKLVTEESFRSTFNVIA